MFEMPDGMETFMWDEWLRRAKILVEVAKEQSGAEQRRADDS